MFMKVDRDCFSGLELEGRVTVVGQLAIICKGYAKQCNVGRANKVVDSFVKSS